MTDSADGGLASFEIAVAGTTIPTSYQVAAIEIEHSVNRIGRARIRLLDGDPSEQDFAASSSSTFVPGSAITVSLGYDAAVTQVFSGVITGQSLSVGGGSGPTLDVECRDKAVLLTVGRKSSAYAASKDSDVLSQIISDAGLTADVKATSATLDELVRYDSSDWDFIVSRAEVNGLLALALNGTVKVFDPLDQSDPAVTLSFGGNLMGFQGELNAVGQVPQVTAGGWDPDNRAMQTATAKAGFSGPGNLSSAKLAQLMGQSACGLRTAAAETTDGLTGWAKAQAAKCALAKIVATATIQGRADILPGGTVGLAGMGDRFNGTHLVTGIRHELKRGNWTCELRLGLDQAWFSDIHEIAAPPAAGLLPGLHGLFNGTVLKIDSDPAGQFRIQVELPQFNDDNAGLWARMAHFYATDGQGAFFLPEVGDEVVVGFLNGDPRFPIILGSLYGKNRKPNAALTPDQDNSQKAFYSKNGLYLLLNDKDKIVTLSTPGGNQLVLDDKNGQVTIADQNGNSIQMGSDGITVKSAKALTVQAAQAATLKGAGGVTVDAGSSDVAVKGGNLSLTAQSQLTAKGSAAAEIQGGGQLTLKGGMVMIN